MLSLLNPSLLPWLFMAGVPLVIHLLTRRTRRRVELPTVKFVQRTVAQQSNLFKWRHLILLALRILAVAALVLAFTLPTMISPLAAPRNERAAAVIIIDTSASMGYTEEGVSTFSRAKDAALKLLAGFGPDIQANVVFCGSHPTAAATEPTSDLGLLEGSIRSAASTQESADPNSAIGMAVEQLGKAQAANKRIYILSDFQRSNWADVKFDSVPSNANVDFISVAATDASNAGITSIRLTPTTPRIGEPVSVECEVFNSSSHTETLPVLLSMSNGQKLSQDVTLEPYSSATASFPLQFDTPERIECTASIPADNLTADDSRRIVIDLKRTAVVVLITDENTSKAPSAAYFLSRVLHPNASSAAGFRVVPVRPEALTTSVLNAADAVIVCDAPMIPSVQYQALTQYTTNGGNLIWFLYGDKIADQMTALGKVLPATSPIPLQIDNISDLSGNGRGYVTLAEAHYDSPLLAAFKDPAAANLSAMHFNKICVTDEVDPRAETLLNFDDGTVAAVHTIEGSGNLLLVNMSPDPAWSDMAKQPAFLPLMHEFLKGLLSKNQTSPEFVAGGSAATSIPSDAAGGAARVSCTGPDGDVPVTTDTTTGSVVIDKVEHDGFYHITKGNVPIVTLAVNTSGDETDLRAIDPRDLETQVKRQSSYFAAMNNAGGDLDSLGRGKPVWQYFMLLALLFLFGEQWIARLTPKVRKA